MTVRQFLIGLTSNLPCEVTVSLVDGFNLPMRISNNVECSVADCPVDLNPSCPAELKGPVDSTGSTVGCKVRHLYSKNSRMTPNTSIYTQSACEANLDGNQADSGNCCSGSHSTPDTCPPAGVQFYSYFKNGCPNSYVYAYDESSGTALWTCDSAKNADCTHKVISLSRSAY